jgi:hypothetical protein
MILAMRFVQRDLTNKGPLQKHYFGRVLRLIGVTGFPNQIFDDSWVVGFWRADHGGHEIEVG